MSHEPEFVKQIDLDTFNGPMDILQKLPFTFKFHQLPAAAGNGVLSAVRYDRDNEDDAGVDVSSLVTFALNVITVAHFFLPAETAAPGNYRVKVQGASQDDAKRDVVNITFSMKA